MRRRASWPAIVVASVVFAALAAPVITGLVTTGLTRAGSQDGIRFPTQVDSYSWWTTPTWWSAIDQPATMVYQNAYGVEFLDNPQAIALGVDGMSYRRVSAAEGLSIPTDQGDPAHMVLSADGTFVVIAGANGHGFVEVHSFVDGSSRRIPTGDDLSAMPLSIDEAGRFVVLMRGDYEMSWYAEGHPDYEVVLLDLETEDLRVLDVPSPWGVAISADGSRIAVETIDDLHIVDATTGDTRRLGIDLSGSWLTDDSWSPDGTGIAIVGRQRLRIIDAADGRTRHDISLGPHEVQADDGYMTSVFYTFVGWRGDTTALIYTSEGNQNSGVFAWLDLASGEQTDISAYESGFTGAALGVPDVARSLIPQWEVSTVGADRGPLQVLVPLLLSLIPAAIAGRIAWGLTPRRRPGRACRRG